MQVKNTQVQEMVILPNPPSRPAFGRVDAGVLSAANEPHAIDWVMQDGSGTVVSFRINTPEEGTVQSIFTIHDMAGNLVNTARNDDLAAGIPGGLPNCDITFY